jgi:hypothetical protein
MRLAFSLLLTLASAFAADPLPAARRVPWTLNDTVGLTAGIPTRARQTNIVTDFGADPTGVTACDTAFANARTALLALGGGTIYFPAGEFKAANTLNLSKGITVKGAGMSNTVVVGYGGNYVFETGFSSTWSDWASANVVTNGHIKGSTSITVSGALSGYFVVGRMMQIARESSTNQSETPINIHVAGSTDNYSFVNRQMVEITSISSQTIGFYPPLFDTWTNWVTKVLPQQYSNHDDVGLEDLSIDANGRLGGVKYNEQDESWVRNVKVWDHSNYGIWLENCLRNQVSGCWIARGPAAASNGAGILVNSTCSTYVFDNIIDDNFPSVEYNYGSSGNVIGYNFAINTNGFQCLDFNHGPHNAFNLVEGNIANSIMSDGYHGSEGPTIYARNWIDGRYTAGAGSPGAIGFTFALKRFSHHSVLLANISGRTNFTMGYSGVSTGGPNMGNGNDNGSDAPPWADFVSRPGPTGFQEEDTNVLYTAIMKGNFNYFNNAIPAGEALGGDTVPSSYYLTGNDTNWMGTLTIPMIDPTNIPGATNAIETVAIIPAQARYFGINYGLGGGGGGGGSPAPIIKVKRNSGRKR